MPRNPGSRSSGGGSSAGGARRRRFRCLVTRCNGMPAVANYLRKPGQSKFRAMALDVLQIEDGLIKSIVTFDLAGLVKEFDLPAEL